MRIIDLQRRLREVGRIRIGEQVPTQRGTRPKRLEHFRLTSRDQLVIEAAAEQWGGTPRPWEGAPDGDQWEVFTNTDTLQVIVPPGDMSFSQSYEQWTAGGCKVRCDGRWDQLADKACHCDPEARACDIHTRLSVMLPDLPGVGVWRLDTQGYYAAVELGGIVDLVASHTERGVMLPARLRLEQRSVKRIDKGKVVTRNFAVPVLDVDVHPLALAAGITSNGELAGPAVPALPVAALTPVPDQPDGVAAPTLAEQIAQVDEQTRKPARSNAAAPLPATGIKPRTAVDAEADKAARTLPAAVVADLRETLNALGVEARRAFLDHFGCAPAELPFDRIDEAVEFVKALAPFDPPPDGGGKEPPSAHGGDAREEVDGEEVTLLPSASDPDYEPEPAPAARSFGVRDVARYSTEVFKADYEAAPKGRKTKTVERLRHAVVYGQTNRRAVSLNDCSIDELIGVYHRLRSIADGHLTYAPDDDGVTFTMVDTGRETRVEWAWLEEVEAA